MSMILDTTRHPYDSISLLNWMLWKWEEEPDSNLLVLTARRDGEPLSNRIRAQLSYVRGQVKEQGGQLSREFGIRHIVIPWTDEYGNRREAVAFEPFQSRRHKFMELFSKDFAPKPDGGDSLLDVEN